MRGFIYSQFVSDRRASEATRREEPPDLEPCNQRGREENQNEKKLLLCGGSVRHNKSLRHFSPPLMPAKMLAVL